MRTDRLVINGTDIDLGTTVIALSFQFANIEDLRSRHVTYSNRFVVPLTDNNIKFFEWSNKHQSKTSKPYVRLADVQYYRRGLPIITNGIVIVNGTGVGFEIELYDGVLSFFDSLGDKLITELDLSSHNTSWTASVMDTKRNATTGVVAPVMSYGKFDEGTPKNIKAQFYLPSIYYHTVIEKIIAEAGRSKLGNIFAESKYLNTIVSFSRQSPQYAESYKDKRALVAAADGTQVLVNPVSERIEFPVISKLGSLATFDGELYTKDTIHGGYGVRVIAILQITVTFGGNVIIYIDTNSGAWIPPATAALGVGVHYFVLDSFIDNGFFTSSGNFEVLCETNSGPPIVTINLGIFKIEIDSEINWFGTVSIADTLLDIAQKDFFKDFAIRNGLVFKEKLEASGHVLECKRLEDILNDKANAVDWTSKRRFTPKETMRFIFNEYAQVNKFKYSPEETKRIPTEFAEGTLDVANENLQPSKDFYTSPFVISSTENIGTIFMALVTAYNEDNASIVTIPPFDNQPGNRLLLVRDKHTNEPAVRYNLTDRSDYKVAYFDDPSQATTLRWQQYLSTNYPALSRALQQAKVISREYYLTDLDIATLDMFKLVFDTDGYYLINKISNHVGGLTKVELFKIQ